MLMSWVFSLAYACAYALVKTSLYMYGSFHQSNFPLIPNNIRPDSELSVATGTNQQMQSKYSQ